VRLTGVVDRLREYLNVFLSGRVGLCDWSGMWAECVNI